MNNQLFDTNQYIDLSNAFASDGKIKKSAAKKLHENGQRWCPKCRRILSFDEFGKLTNGSQGLKPYCRECNNREGRKYIRDNAKKFSERHRSRKSELVELFGGRCSRCGYNEFVAGLDFHHVIKNTKKRGISLILSQTTEKTMLERKDLLEELDKCALLCRNCHTAINRWQYTITWEKVEMGWIPVQINK